MVRRKLAKKPAGGKSGSRSKAPAKRIRIDPESVEQAILRRGIERPWATRRKRGVPYQADVFDYIWENYLKDWPDITSTQIARADPELASYYHVRKARVVALGGVLPAGFPLITGWQAKDLRDPDPRRANWRSIEAERKKAQRAKAKAKS